MKEQSRKIALCGVSCALAVTIMLLGGILPLATFCAPMLAMVVLLPVLSECGSRMAAAAYGTVALLALLLVSDREMSLIFLFFGWYPLLQPKLLRLPSRLLRLICKLFFCNQMMCIFVNCRIDKFVFCFKIFIVQNNLVRIRFVKTVYTLTFFATLRYSKFQRRRRNIQKHFLDFFVIHIFVF